MTAEIASDAYNFAKLNFVAQRQFKSPLTKYNELQPILLFAREAGIFTGPHLFNNIRKQLALGISDSPCPATVWYHFLRKK